MLDVVKWTATAAMIMGFLVAIVSIFAQPIATIAPNLITTVTTLINIVGVPLRAARGLLNIFFMPWSLPIVSFSVVWVTTKPFQLAGITFVRSILKGIFS